MFIAEPVLVPSCPKVGVWCPEMSQIGHGGTMFLVSYFCYGVLLSAKK